MVEARFKVVGKKETEYNTTVELTAVNKVEGDNTQWSQFTPQGTISMAITNPDAVKEFKVGKTYAVILQEI